MKLVVAGGQRLKGSRESEWAAWELTQYVGWHLRTKWSKFRGKEANSPVRTIGLKKAGCKADSAIGDRATDGRHYPARLRKSKLAPALNELSGQSRSYAW